MPKLRRNIRRDAEAAAALKAMGYHVVALWECDVERDTWRAARAVTRALERRRLAVR
jgi:G:T-mismatch repair DNA endonuclease (very short patch repair protein)